MRFIILGTHFVSVSVLPPSVAPQCPCIGVVYQDLPNRVVPAFRAPRSQDAGGAETVGALRSGVQNQTDWNVRAAGNVDAATASGRSISELVHPAIVNMGRSVYARAYTQ